MSNSDRHTFYIFIGGISFMCSGINAVLEKLTSLGILDRLTIGFFIAFGLFLLIAAAISATQRDRI